MEQNIALEQPISPASSAQAEAPAATKKVFMKTYGCQMNVYDSQLMTDALAADGYRLTDNMEEADLVLLNTCHIREKAAEKVYSELGRIRKLKEEKAANGQELLIGVTGCVAQAEGQEIIRRAPAVDLVVGPQTYHRLPSVVKRARSGEKVVETEYAIEDKFEHLPQPEKAAVRHRGVTAFLTVQEGCDKFCTFCVVPYTRGAEISRPVSQILAEAERLAEAGDLAGAAELNARTWLGPDAAPETRSFLAEMQHRAYTLQLAADPEPEQREEEIDLDRLTMPALVVCGAHDLGYFRDSARHLAERLPQATLVELEWAGHLPSMERPEETTKLITEFLSR